MQMRLKFVSALFLVTAYTGAQPPVIPSAPPDAISRGMTTPGLNVKIDAATQARVIGGAIASLNEFYIFPETAKKMEAALRTRQKMGDFDAASDGETFARVLTGYLQEISHDKHLSVTFSPGVLPKGEPGHDADAQERMRAQVERMNCFFERAELLPANLGYLKFNAFIDPAVCGVTATAAMNFLGKADAIIFDLRDNLGGRS
jgi:hypothetical protein